MPPYLKRRRSLRGKVCISRKAKGFPQCAAAQPPKDAIADASANDSRPLVITAPLRLDWRGGATPLILVDELQEDIFQVRQTDHTASAFVLFHDGR